jgi:ABC-type polysaccharide/polyol phosphate export permease
MISAQLRAFTLLIRRDLLVSWSAVVSDLLDTIVWAIAFAFVNGAMMPLMGITPHYGTFIAVSAFILGLFDALDKASNLVNDLNSTQRIRYELTLPLSPYLVFLKYTVCYAVEILILNSSVLPIVKLVLGSQFSLAGVQWPLFIFVCLILHAFLATMGLWAASIATSSSYLRMIRNRIVIPLWFIGCYQFPWQLLHAHYPVLSYLNLFNPFALACEALRASFIGQAGSLSLYLTIPLLSALIVLGWFDAVRRFKKRLDFV